MQKPSLPDNEEERLKELLEYRLLDTAAEPSYDDITMIASSICQTPVALVSLIDKDRQWFKSRIGLELPETHRDVSFCGHAIHENEVFVIGDAKADTRFFDNPLVESGFVRFYAGAPLISARGYALGTLCVIDQKPRQLTFEQIQALKALARQVVRNMELDRSLHTVQQKYSEITYLSKIVSRQKTDLIETAKHAAVGTLAAGMAHEVNNPLTIIQGKCRRLKLMLERQEFHVEKMANEVDTIEKMVGRIALITKGLLTFSRGYDRTAFAMFETQEILDQVLALSRERIRVSGITLNLSGVGDVQLEGAAGQIVRVLMNLISNAFDAVETLETKWIKLEIGEAEDRVIFAVTDSGPGIPEEHVNRIMEPFFSTKDVGKGVGLGLSLSKGIADQHGGRLYLDTRSAHTRFVLELPKTQSKRSAPATAA